MGEHYGEPWEVFSDDDVPDIRVAGKMMGNIVCEAPVVYDLSMSAWPKRSARIVACVNACKGIPTAAMESGILAEVLAMARAVVAAESRSSEQWRAIEALGELMGRLEGKT